MIELSQPATPAEFEAYFEFRWQQLRAPWDQPYGSERDELEDVAWHVAACSETGELVGVGRIHQTADNEARIRYVATLQSYQGQGVGRAIVAKLEQFARESDVNRIVLNARQVALPFYEKLGYEIIGIGPTIFGSIEHKRMRKHL